MERQQVLLMRLTESIHHSGRVAVIMDSGSYVLEGSGKVGFCRCRTASAVIKKHQYWPKHIDGEAKLIRISISKESWSRPIASQVHLDGTNFKVFCMKEEDYVMKLMATYGALRLVNEGATQRSVTRQSGIRENVNFNYTEPIFNHFKFRHQVDDHNNNRHSPISVEESVNTKDWRIRVFTFILAVVEVNAQTGLSIFYVVGFSQPAGIQKIAGKRVDGLFVCCQ
jgi:hypothetical protein